ncbi:tyrosine protein kinase [Enterococcus sp. BWM-S5]|uniref:Capsular polysaccharide biosynthesis protein CpsC n=1 Tax=Enterococcus larvae TaxID=2794352 RepID=A0ABS4CJR5_9ENTE|nr:Wzz/FepE/Etk N-terminal domain-containing protein [Enterococcus larvae]MBP1046361.1 tyrosine protein kinase [Enterococcus larvae]
MEETIGLQEITRILKKRFALLIFCMILGISAAGVMTFFVITPRYSSQAQLIVRLPQSETANVNDINANLQMISTYKDLITSDTVLSAVQQRMKDEYGQDIGTGTLRGSLSVKQSQNSQMFSISSTTTDPILSERIANQTTAVFQETAQQTLSVDKITVISNASANMSAVSPNNKMNLMLGFAGGLMLGVLLAFVLELFDRSLKNEEFISEELELPILGAVPNMTAKELNVKITRTPSEMSEMAEHHEEEAPADEHAPLRRTRTRL